MPRSQVRSPGNAHTDKNVNLVSQMPDLAIHQSAWNMI